MIHPTLQAIGIKGEEGYYFADDGFGNLVRVFFVQFSYSVFN